jgi:hypothetical protein
MTLDTDFWRVYTKHDDDFGRIKADVSPATWNSYHSALIALASATKKLEKELNP